MGFRGAGAGFVQLLAGKPCFGAILVPPDVWSCLVMGWWCCEPGGHTPAHFPPVRGCYCRAHYQSTASAAPRRFLIQLDPSVWAGSDVPTRFLSLPGAPGTLVPFSPLVPHSESIPPIAPTASSHRAWGRHPVTVSDSGEEKSGGCEGRARDTPYRCRSPETPSFGRWAHLRGCVSDIDHTI